MRSIAARKSDYRCHYCRVPTAATIEHLDARSKGGSHWSENLALACPFCNRRKSARDIDEFISSGDYKLNHPSLPETIQLMLIEWFRFPEENKDKPTFTVMTGSTNAQLAVKNNEVVLLVRAHKLDPWHECFLGKADSPAVITGAWDFLIRHDTKKTDGKKLIL